ncbi:tail fiber domain-containing protein [Microbacterium sp. SSW1-47]|uniref:tail fiber domain-containing protein n=1 Tax=Microbacterium sufflavum TaxID=2851649 RepID=UPI001FFD7961|nr:tail fiber domain-containing protein [Microbacterium sufflavum]MCK2028093.1 tail fiber domain-containing protein [Microbacterium sufflavum]
MANGDAAFAAGMDILDGNEDRRDGWDEINKSRDYVAQFAAGIRSIAAGGTGANTAVQALINLGALPKAEVFDGTGSVFNKVPRYDAAGRLICAAPTAANHAVPLGTVNSLFVNYIARWGGTIDQGPLYMPALTAVTSSYVAMYRNGDGRVGISPSARRFKKEIKDRTYTREQLRAIRVVSYRLRADVFGEGWEEAPVDVGVIAEELIDAGLSEFVVFDENGDALSVHYERLALVAIGALQDALDQLDTFEDRLAALEAGRA